MTFNNHLKASNPQEVSKGSQYSYLAQSVCFPSSKTLDKTPKVPKVDSNQQNSKIKLLAIQTSGHPKTQKVYFTTIKKQNTFYLQMMCRGVTRITRVKVLLCHLEQIIDERQW
ncbi:hypothetical protein DDM94_01010 [Vibrio cholerae]|nr:hypothetical protein [Vibrio cholerae]